MTDDVRRLVVRCSRLAGLATAQPAEEHHYAHLPLCIIDTVFSRGVRYEGTVRVIRRYCDYFDLHVTAYNPPDVPSEHNQQAVATFVDEVERVGIDRFTDRVFGNRQRTSPQNGILKGEACWRFGKALLAHGANYLQDVPALERSADFQHAIQAIPGQRNALEYFFICAGSTNRVNPGRWVVGFVERSLGRAVSPAEAKRLLIQACTHLQDRYPTLTPRLLDHCIWECERDA